MLACKGIFTTPSMAVAVLDRRKPKGFHKFCFAKFSIQSL